MKTDTLDDGASPAAASKRAGPMSVHRVLSILMTLGESNTPQTLAELSRALATPKPSLLSLLNELMTLAYVQRDEHGRFSLGRMAYRLALQLNTTDSLTGAIHGALREAGMLLDMTVSFAYLDLDRRGVIYADRYAPPSSQIRYLAKLGYPGEVHASAPGKLLLATREEAQWRDWLGPEPFRQFTPHTHTRFDAIAPELRRIRQTQIAWTRSEQHYGIGGCAVPVFDRHGTVAASVSAHTLLQVMEPNGERVVASLQAAADRVREELTLRRIDATDLPRFI